MRADVGRDHAVGTDVKEYTGMISGERVLLNSPEPVRR